MGDKQFAKDPLLFIHQPLIATPEAKMQHSYTTSKNTTDRPMEIKADEGIKQRRVRRSYINEIAEVDPPADPADPEIIDTDISEPDNDDDRKFKDMTLIEKITYLSSRPEQGPHIRCEIKANNKVIQGVITGFKDERVFIQTPRRVSSSEILLEEIESVRMLGLL